MQAITDEEVWLLKVLWFQGWSIDAFQPWFWEDLFQSKDHRHHRNPIYRSLEELSQAALLPNERVEHHLANFENQRWLSSSPKQPYKIINRRHLLQVITQAQLSKKTTAYKIACKRNVWGFSKHHGVPLFYEPHARDRAFSAAINTHEPHLSRSQELTGFANEYWGRFDGQGDGVTGSVLHLLEQGFRLSADFPLAHLGKEDTIELLDLEECDDDKADVFICDSSRWSKSIGWAATYAAHFYADLLQSYLDLHLFNLAVHSEYLPWLERLLCGNCPRR